MYEVRDHQFFIVYRSDRFAYAKFKAQQAQKQTGKTHYVVEVKEVYSTSTTTLGDLMAEDAAQIEKTIARERLNVV